MEKPAEKSGSPPATMMPRLPTSVLVAGDQSLLLVSREFLPLRFRIQEFMPFRAARIEPSNNCVALPRTLIREHERGVLSRLLSLARNREERRDQFVLFVEDLDYLWVADGPGQLNPVGPCRQSLSGNLPRLAKGYFGGLIYLVCVQHGQYDCRRKHQAKN